MTSAPRNTMLSPVTIEDEAAGAELVVDNWHYETIFRFLYPKCFTDRAAVYKHVIPFVQRDFRKPKSHTIKATIDDKLVAFGKWTLVKGNAEETSDPLIEEPKIVPPEGSQKFRDEVMKVAAKQFEKHLKGVDHCELDVMNVYRAYQGSGIGAKILHACFEEADGKNLPIFVMSVPNARDFYAKHGFEEVDHFEMDLADWAGPNRGWGKYRFYGLIRPAQL